MSGTVERFDNRSIYVNLGSIEAQLSKQDQIPGEVFQSHDRIEVFVYKVEDNPRGVNVFVSRSHPEMCIRDRLYLVWATHGKKLWEWSSFAV